MKAPKFKDFLVEAPENKTTKSFSFFSSNSADLKPNELILANFYLTMMNIRQTGVDNIIWVEQLWEIILNHPLNGYLE